MCTKSIARTTLKNYKTLTPIYNIALNDIAFITVYSGYSGHVNSGHSDIAASFTGTKYIYSIIFRSDIVANRI